MKPPRVLPQVNPPADCGSCDPRQTVVYLAVNPADRVTRPSLALLNQELACRRYTRCRLHRRIEAEYADSPSLPGSRRQRRYGFARLLAHVALCHNRQVVVARLDRLPQPSAAVRLRRIGARVLSAGQPNSRTVSDQAEMANQISRDMARLFPQPTSQRKEHHNGSKQ